MTQPSLHQTFDTSLIDLGPDQAHSSFSTTDSVPSDEYRQDATTVPAPLRVSTPRFEEASTTGRKMPTRYVPTIDAYDAWAEVYDADGNALQAIDDYELGTGGMLKQFVDEVCMPKNRAQELKLVDLGCGTGRNTAQLFSQAWPEDYKIHITGIDASAGMLEKAMTKLGTAYKTCTESSNTKIVYSLLRHDFLDPVDANRPPIVLASGFQFDGLITTLVLEHFPLPTFFAVIKSLVKPNGVVLLTNMHDEMGNRSQAGFVSQDEKTGEAIKVRGTSWVHSVKETIDAAKNAGFELVGDAKERAVTKAMIEDGVVGERARKWIDVNMWYGVILRKIS